MGGRGGDQNSTEGHKILRSCFWRSGAPQIKWQACTAKNCFLRHPSAVVDPDGKGGGHGTMPLPWGSYKTCPLGHQPGTLFCLQRAIPYESTLASRGPGTQTFGPRGQFDSKTAILHQTAIHFYLYVDRFQFQEAFLSFRVPRSL